MKLLQELFAQGILSEERLNELQSEAQKLGKAEEEIILEKKIVPEDQLFEIKVTGTSFHRQRKFSDV